MGQATKRVDQAWINCSEELMNGLIDQKIQDNTDELQKIFDDCYQKFKENIEELLDESNWIEISNRHVLAVRYQGNYVLFANPIYFSGLRESRKIEDDWFQNFDLPEVDMLQELIIKGKDDCPLICPIADDGNSALNQLSSLNDEKSDYLVQSKKDREKNGSIDRIAYKINDVMCGYIDIENEERNSSYYDSWNGTIKIPVREYEDTFGSWPLFLLENNLIPKKLQEKNHVINLYKWFNKLQVDANGVTITNELASEIKNGKYESIETIKFDRNQLKQEILSDHTPQTVRGDLFAIVAKELAECDKRRINRTPYSLERLTDPNQGHWELWQAQTDRSDQKKNSGNKQGQKKTEGMCFHFQEGVFARNPVEDIMEDGVVGIDFGTKSTIVVRLDEHSEIRQMRVGRGDLSKGIQTGDFENPTIMEFTNIRSFMDRYQQKEGRPDTLWNDVAISHEAKNDFLDSSDTDNYYAFFSDLKQWCADDTRQIMLRDKCGEDRLLPDFLDIKEGAFNPIELYAYYLGLFINNMDNKIYMRYILSYPVNYSLEIREKILACFERGIKKSLPQEVLDDRESMKMFEVSMGASEPAAYAICALKEFGFEPETDKPVFYGIYDFGGGTTDFDYGSWKKVDNSRRYTREINHFGAGGVKYLGGENLLEEMAYEILKDNKESLRKEKVKFAKPVLGKDFDESSALVGDSQYARRNINNVAEELRSYWEDPEILVRHEKNGNDEDAGITQEAAGNLSQTAQQEERKTDADTGKDLSNGRQQLTSVLDAVAQKKVENPSVEISESGENGEKKAENSSGVSPAPGENREEKEDISAVYSGEIKVSLFTEQGKMLTNTSLKVNEKQLFQLLKQRIESGVDNFFQGFKNCSDNPELNEMDHMRILLAGNSSKSPLVWSAFQEKIKSLDEEMKRKIEVIPPLGSKQAEEIQQENGINLDRDSYERPTGKTGVAFGLVWGREGSEIKVVSEVKAQDEAKFGFYLGYAQSGEFRILKERDEIEIGTWYEWDAADVKQSELLYSSLPEATTNKMPVKKANRKILQLQKKYENGETVYIRAVSPNEIEYAVAADDEAVKQQNYIEKPVKKLLSE